MIQKDKDLIEEFGAKPAVLEEEDYEYNDEGELVPKKYVSLAQRNPNGACQFTPDPRQELAWKYYINGLARGIPNAKKAALQAGYSPAFAANVVSTKWFKDKKAKLKRKNALTLAERNLFKMLRMDWSDMKIVDGREVEEVNVDKLKVVKDVSMYITETLGKDEGYSKKVVEDKNVSHDIKIESVSYADATEIPAPAQELIRDAVIEEIQNG